MKRVLIQTPLDAETMIDFVKKIIFDFGKREDVSIYSPIMLIVKKEDDHEFNIVSRLFSIAKATTEKNLPFLEKDLQIYIGPAPKELKFDQVITYNKNLLSTQEAFLNVDYSVVLEGMYLSDDSEQWFQDIDDIVTFLGGGAIDSTSQ